MWPSLGSLVDFLSRGYPTAPYGLLVHDHQQQFQLAFGMQQLKDSGSHGRSISSGHTPAARSKTCCFRNQRFFEACFTVMVNARTPKVVDMNARTSRLAIRLNCRTPRLLPVSVSEPLLFARTLGKGFYGVKKGSRNCTECLNLCLPERPSFLFICRNGQKAPSLRESQ